ncbi:hypothetical protein VNO78_14821 [Psophocarpus tetragonolobus]|uniref:Uncharacterized protein n=1 Tax=Psophocarpus tetragonolobus TaxID=3891 RepID=A0AAN9SD07_PSOTE
MLEACESDVDIVYDEDADADADVDVNENANANANACAHSTCWPFALRGSHFGSSLTHADTLFSSQPFIH